jgi:hypothetical protein
MVAIFAQAHTGAAGSKERLAVAKLENEAKNELAKAQGRKLWKEEVCYGLRDNFLDLFLQLQTPPLVFFLLLTRGWMPWPCRVTRLLLAPFET